jgi:hypothetical protein
MDLMAAIARYRKELEEKPGLVRNYLMALESVGAKLPRSEPNFRYDKSKK